MRESGPRQNQVEAIVEAPEKMEFSFLLVKPNATKVGLTGILRQELIEAGFDIVGEQQIRISRYAAETFYSSLGEKKEPVIEHITSGDSYVFMVYGSGVIKRLREFQGHTEWKDRPAKGLRGKYAVDHIQNSVHCPDSHQEAVTELEIVFTDLKEKMLKSQLADEIYEFLNDSEAIEKGERYLSAYAV
jgi:nucleoside-diphosphate kinase